MEKRRKYRKWLVLIALAALAGFGGLYGLKASSGPEGETGNTSPETPSLATVGTGSIESVVTAQGKLEPKEYVDVGAQVSGQLETLHVEIGDEVKTGDPVAEIDAEIFESKVAGDEARLKTMQAGKAETEAEIRQAQQNVTRNSQLFSVKAVSQQVLEDSQTALAVAQAQLLSLEAQIDEARSTLEGNKASLNYTKIYAPMDGTIVDVKAREGETLNANQTTPTIVRVADLDTMTVRAQVAEADINKIVPAMPVYFTTLGSQDRRWQGTVRQLLPTPEVVNDVVLYNVLVDVGNEDRKLMSGMTTQMFFVLGRAENVPVVPTAALVKKAPDAPEGEGQAYIVQIMEGRKPADRVVRIGLSDRAGAEVLSGLKPGDKVVIPAPKIPERSAEPRMRMPRL